MYRHRCLLAILLVTVLLGGCARSSLAGAGDHPPTEDTGGTGDAGDGSDDPGTTSDDTPAPLVANDEITVQLDGPATSLFGGFYAADDQDFFTAVNLDVTLTEADPGQDAVAVVADPAGPEFLVSWAAPVLKAREAGADLVNIAQILSRSGTRIVALKGSGISTASSLASHTVMTLDAGRDVDVRAALAGAGVAPSVVKLKPGPFAPAALYGHAADAQEVEVFDEWAQILETPDPAIGDVHDVSDFSVIDQAAGRTGTLQEGIYARASWLAEVGHEAIATRFLEAAFRGYAFCRDDLEDCSQLAIDNGGVRSIDHEAWVLNEVNALIWPAPAGIGTLDPAEWAHTIQLATAAGVITKAPDAAAARTDLAAKAQAAVKDDLEGAGYAKQAIEIVPLVAQPSDAVPSDEPIVTLPPP